MLSTPLAVIRCYTASTQGLQPIASSQRSLNLNQTTPPTGPPNTPSHVIFNEAGDKLVASVKGTPPADPGFLAVWDVSQDGTLSADFTKIGAPTGGLLPFSMTNINGRNAILATDAGVGFDIFDFSTVKNTQTKADQTSPRNNANAINGQGATCWSSFSAKTGSFYLTDIGTSIITEVSVDKSLKGKIVQVCILPFPRQNHELTTSVGLHQQFPQGNGSATIDNDIATIGKHELVPLTFMSLLTSDQKRIS